MLVANQLLLWMPLKINQTYSPVLLSLRLVTWDTINGNFSTSTVLGSRPKLLSSESEILFRKKCIFMINFSKKGS
jgi:hypothetical protein